MNLDTVTLKELREERMNPLLRKMLKIEMGKRVNS